MIRLLAETPRDQEMIEKFQRAYENLKKIVDRLQEENRKLREELEEYRKRHPSTVGVKNNQPYAIREESPMPDVTQAKRKPGGQPGHTGHHRKIPGITERIRVHADQFTCPECSSVLVKKGMRSRVVEDIPETRPRVIRYRIERMYCRNCGRIYEPDIMGVLPGARLSLRTMLIAAYMKNAMRMSLESVSESMGELFSIRISEGEVQDILYQLSHALGPEYDSLVESMRKAPSRYTDTTTWRRNGENHALWVFVTKAEAIFHVSGSNNHEVAGKILGKHSGTDVHDRFKAFDTLASETHNTQQYCWSHIICDAKELEEFYGDEGRIIKESLQRIHEEAKSFHSRGTREDVDHLHEKLTFLLDRDYAHRRSGKFVDNLLRRRRDWLFRFVVDPEVESTNNRAERALRPAVIYRKVTGGSRSDRGAEAYATLSSIFYTQKLRKKSIIRDVPALINRKETHPG